MSSIIDLFLKPYLGPIEPVGLEAFAETDADLLAASEPCPQYQ
jgi:hypothetical protein